MCPWLESVTPRHPGQHSAVSADVVKLSFIPQKERAALNSAVPDTSDSLDQRLEAFKEAEEGFNTSD